MCNREFSVVCALLNYHPGGAYRRQWEFPLCREFCGDLPRKLADSLRQAGPTFSVTTIGGVVSTVVNFSRGRTMSRKHYRIIADAIGTIADGDARCVAAVAMADCPRPVVRQIRPGALSLGLRGDRMTTRELSALIGKEGLEHSPDTVAVRC